MTAALVRGLVALLVLSALAFAAQPPLVEALIAPWRVVMETLEPDFRVVHLHAIKTGVEPLIEVVVAPARIILVGTRVIVPDGTEQAAAAISRGVVWLSLTVFLVPLLAWPVSQARREWPLRLALGLPLLGLVLLLDVPVSLLGPLRSLVSGVSSGDADLWIIGARFLRNGGRFLFAIAGAALACLLCQAISQRMQKP